MAEKGSFEGKYEILRTISQLKTLSANIPASQKGVYLCYNPPINFHIVLKPLQQCPKILYKAALTELEEQFGNEELVAGAVMKTVLDHPIVAEGDVTRPRSFSNTLHNAVATIKSLGYSHDLASSTNTRAALQKLPDPFKEKWGERKIEIRPTTPTSVDLDEWLRARLRANALVSEPLPSRGKPPKCGRSGYRRPPRKGDQGIGNRQEQLQ